MTDRQRKLAELALQAIQKLSIEYSRGTVEPRAEYDWAIKRLDEMKREFSQ